MTIIPHLTVFPLRKSHTSLYCSCNGQIQHLQVLMSLSLSFHMYILYSTHYLLLSLSLPPLSLTHSLMTYQSKGHYVIKMLDQMRYTGTSHSADEDIHSHLKIILLLNIMWLVSKGLCWLLFSPILIIFYLLAVLCYFSFTHSCLHMACEILKE